MGGLGWGCWALFLSASHATTTINVLYHMPEDGWHECPSDQPQKPGCGLMSDMINLAFPAEDGYVINGVTCQDEYPECSWGEYMQIFNKTADAQPTLGYPNIDAVDWHIGGSLTTVTEGRGEYLHFSTGWRGSGYRLIIKDPASVEKADPYSAENMFWWMNPFTPLVWTIFMFFTPWVATLCVFLLETHMQFEHNPFCDWHQKSVFTMEWFEPTERCEACGIIDSGEGFPPGIQGLGLALFYCYSVTFFTHDRIVRYPVTKIFLVAYQFSTLLFVTIYTSTLMAFIVGSSAIVKQIESPNQLQLKTNVGCTIRSWATGEWMANRGFPSTKWCKNIDECADWVESGECDAFILDNGYADIMLKTRCDLMYSGDSFNPVFFGMMISNSLIASEEHLGLNNRLAEIIEKELPDLYFKYVSGGGSCPVKESGTNSDPSMILDIPQILGIMVMFWFMGGVSVIFHFVSQNIPRILGSKQRVEPGE